VISTTNSKLSSEWEVGQIGAKAEAWTINGDWKAKMLPERRIGSSQQPGTFELKSRFLDS
jgi:hypothetical protein